MEFVWKHTFARIGEDWVFLALLGIIMALVSFAMDYTISLCGHAREILPGFVLSLVETFRVMKYFHSVATPALLCHKESPYEGHFLPFVGSLWNKRLGSSYVTKPGNISSPGCGWSTTW